MALTDAVNAMLSDLISIRRDLHKHAESGWTEFRTTALLIEALQALGYEVAYGRQIHNPAFMAGLPEPAALAQHMQRAVEQGANPTLVAAMEGGMTGCVATLRCGEGPTIAVRCDIDALDQIETVAPDHLPNQNGFASINPGMMHACGHDGHAVIGLGIARLLMANKAKLRGTIKLIFQPAEEGVRGARSLVEAGIVDDVDYLLGAHLGFEAKETGLLICGTGGFLATSKLDAHFTGVPAHAGAAPQEGKNAMLAAAAAVLNLHAIARHSKGASRINVGTLQAGTGRNVVPAHATLKLETRGEDSAINAYMQAEAERVLQASAQMWDCGLRIVPQGSAAGAVSDQALSSLVERIAKECPAVQKIQPFGLLGGSEDVTWMMERVQSRGGQATYLMVGSKIAAPHHDSRFDFDEASIGIGVEVITRTILELAGR
ncbi:MAG TPA: amidohydrolase [Symbiobacteriaceae bacterium]|nr:amidohydrolase [Symbiobacteriaceae bacterium]